jgi:hypothetical protein
MTEPGEAKPADVPAGESKQPAKPEIGERVGRALGKAFLRVKKTRIWQDTKASYRDSIDGKK